MMNGDEARFLPKTPDHSIIAKMCIFWQFLIFCKKSRNTNEKLISYSESAGFFWSPCKISRLGKVWFTQNGALSDRDWRVFSGFWVIHEFDQKSSNKTRPFYHWKWKSKALSNLPRKPHVKIRLRSWFMARGIRVLFSTSVEHIPRATEWPARVSHKVMVLPARGILRFLARL